MSFVSNLMLDIIEKSKQLLLLANKSKWDEFASLDAERQTLILKCDLGSIEMTEQENARVYSQMRELLALNEELESRCVSQRDNVVGELQQLRKSNKVAKAYSQ